MSLCDNCINFPCTDGMSICQFIGCDRSGQCDIYVPKMKSIKVDKQT